MIFYDVRDAVRGVRDLPGVPDLRISFVVEFECCFKITVIISGINGRKVELDNEFVQPRLRDAIPIDFPISIQPAS